MAQQHHYIPQFYLKGFLDPRSLGRENVKPYLWCVDIKKKKVKASTPKNVAKSAGFYDYEIYDVSVEEHLSKIEGVTAPIIEKIRNNKFHLNEEERFHLSLYIGLQISRVPAYRDIIQAAEYRKVRKEIKRVLKGKDENIDVIPPKNFSDYLIGMSFYTLYQK